MADSRYSLGDFREHGGSKRAPPLAKFYGVIYFRVHFRIAGIGENRAAAERARAEFHAALKPAKNFSVGQHFGGSRGGIGDARGANFVGFERFRDFRVGKFRAEIGVAHFARRKFSVVIEHGSERRAQADAVVTGSGLNEDAVYQAGGENLAVGLGIERDAAGEAKIAAAGLRDGCARESDHGLLAHILHGEGHVLVARVDFGFRNAAGAEARFDAGDRRGIFAEQAMGIHAVGIVVRDYEIAQVDSGLAVGREAHDLPFVAVRSEAEVVGELRVKKAERIGPRNGPEMFEAAIAAAPERGGFPGAASIEDEDGGVIEPREGVSADGVGEMMIHETKARLRVRKHLAETIFAAALVPHAGEMAGGIEECARIHRLLVRYVAIKIVEET